MAAILSFLIQIIIACLLCFFGYRYMRFLFSAYGFMLGIFLCTLLVPASLIVPLQILIYALSGALFGYLFYLLYNVSVFVSGAGLGLVLGLYLSFLLNLQPFSLYFFIVIAALSITLGALMLVYKKIVLIIATAATGAFQLVLYGGYLLFHLFAPTGQYPLPTTSVDHHTAFTGFFEANLLLLLIAILVFFLLGFFVQRKKYGKGK
ncbi:MAG: DUF4203 domain-containing protein [Christensenellaceae bacterium]